MEKVKYTVKENTKFGSHSFYAVPVTNGTLDITDADGGTGTAVGADGEADRELRVSAQHGAVGTETAVGAVGLTPTDYRREAISAHQQ